MELIPTEYKKLIRMLHYLSGLSLERTSAMLKAVAESNGNMGDVYDLVIFHGKTPN